MTAKKPGLKQAGKHRVRKPRQMMATVSAAERQAKACDLAVEGTGGEPAKICFSGIIGNPRRVLRNPRRFLL